jgi:hypothetical protein
MSNKPSKLQEKRRVVKVKKCISSETLISNLLPLLKDSNLSIQDVALNRALGLCASLDDTFEIIDWMLDNLPLRVKCNEGKFRKLCMRIRECCNQ